MARNVEIKARVESMDALRAAVAAIVTSPPEVIEQRDTFFHVPHGRLKLREFADGSGELIAYQRPDQSGPRLSTYAIHPTRDPSSLGGLLEDALGVRGVVEKRRELHLVGQTRIHLDEVRGLGPFLELEVVLREGQHESEGRAIALDLLSRLGVGEDALVPTAYVDLLAERALA